jgi:hypothetical protein
MSDAAWIILTLVGTASIATVAWARWRFRRGRMEARADKLLADADARMRARDDAALLALFADPLGQTPAARRVRGLVDERRFAVLAREWHDLWPTLVNQDKLSLDRAIDLGAAIKVLAERHPSSS